MFKENVRLKEPKNMRNLLTRAPPYTHYEEKLIDKDVKRNKIYVSVGSGWRWDNKRREERENKRHKEPRFRFYEYTLLLKASKK